MKKLEYGLWIFEIYPEIKCTMEKYLEKLKKTA